MTRPVKSHPRDRPYLALWVPGGSYHVYSRAVNGNLLFVDARDVRKFREKLRRLLPFCELFALACVGNHFHLHLRVRREDEIRARLLARQHRAVLGRRQRRWLAGDLSFQELLGDAFARTLHAYTKAFNLRHGREGDLFNHTVRRRRVRGDLLSRRLVCYIHAQWVKHARGNGKVYGQGASSSFAELIGEGRPSHLFAAAAVLARFGGRAAFIEQHRAYVARRRGALRRFGEARFFGCETPRARAGRPVWLM